MRWFRKALGVDLSGSRIAVIAVRAVPGGPSAALPPLSHEFRAERGAARLEEAESVLGEYVARHGLVGAEAYLVVPAARVHMGRAVFPPMRERDLREAVGLELDRLFPVSPDTLRYGYLRIPGPAGKGTVPLVVAAAAREYLETCGQVVSRAGLSLAAAVPAGWAAGAAVARILAAKERRSGHSALLRWLGDSVECTVFAGAAPLFCSTRPCTPETAPAEGVSLALEGLSDVSAGPEEPVDMIAPDGWFPEKEFPAAGAVSFRAADGFPAAAGGILFGAGTPAGGADPIPFLAAYGAVAGGREMDLLSPAGAGEVSPAARTAVAVSAAAALLLGAAWPATVAWRAKADLERMDRQVATLRPFAERHEKTLAEIDGAREKLGVLQAELSASGEPIRILKELTDRIPNGTWLQSLRVEGRKFDIEGYSPSASEIFPALTHDGRFRSVDFGAPITRQANNLERFRLSGEYVPPAAAAATPKPSPKPAPVPGRKP